MKINKITQTDLGIEVEAEGYPHAHPVFPADISAKDLKTALKAWKINQDEVDAINKAAQEAPVPAPKEVRKELKDLEGVEIEE